MPTRTWLVRKPVVGGAKLKAHVLKRYLASNPVYQFQQLDIEAHETLMSHIRKGGHVLAAKRRHVNKNPLKPKVSWKCPCCGKTFKLPSVYSEHARGHAALLLRGGRSNSSSADFRQAVLEYCDEHPQLTASHIAMVCSITKQTLTDFKKEASLLDDHTVDQSYISHCKTIFAWKSQFFDNSGVFTGTDDQWNSFLASARKGSKIRDGIVDTSQAVPVDFDQSRIPVVVNQVEEFSDTEEAPVVPPPARSRKTSRKVAQVPAAVPSPPLARSHNLRNTQKPETPQTTLCSSDDDDVSVKSMKNSLSAAKAKKLLKKTRSSKSSKSSKLSKSSKPSKSRKASLAQLGHDDSSMEPDSGVDDSDVDGSPAYDASPSSTSPSDPSARPAKRRRYSKPDVQNLPHPSSFPKSSRRRYQAEADRAQAERSADDSDYQGLGNVTRSWKTATEELGFGAKISGGLREAWDQEDNPLAIKCGGRRIQNCLRDRQLTFPALSQTHIPSPFSPIPQRFLFPRRAEFNEKLADTLTKLREAGAGKREKDAKVSSKRFLLLSNEASQGRVVDLRRPTQQKDGIVVQTVLGRNVDSIVCDTEKTAITCIEYTRDQRLGTATFLPLDTVQVKAISDKYRNFAKGARLAIDVIYFTLFRFFAVTLEGTVIHKAGIITGGVSRTGSRQFEDQEIEGLHRREAELRSKLVVKDGLGSSTDLRLKGIKDELKVLRTKAKELSKTLSTLEKELSSIETKAESLREEEKQLRGAQEDHAQMLQYETQLARLDTQNSFNRDQLATIQERHEYLQKTVTTQEALLEQSKEEKETKQADFEALEQEVEEVKESWEESKKAWEEKNQELEDVKKSESKATKALEKALKDIATCNDEIERLSSERFTIYRRCKMEEINLFLSKGTLEDIPIEEAAAPAAPMDVYGPEEGTQNIFEANDYGVEVDFDELDEGEQEDGSAEMETALNEAVTNLQSEIEKMSVNLKAIEWGPQGGITYLSLEEPEEPYLHGIKYHAMPPLKRFRDMEQLSGGEKRMAALALLFAMHSFHPSPFFVLDEVDGALDNTNVQRVARYVQQRTEQGDFQCIVIPQKLLMYESSNALVGLLKSFQSAQITHDSPVLAHSILQLEESQAALETESGYSGDMALILVVSATSNSTVSDVALETQVPDVPSSILIEAAVSMAGGT
ncbi:hypothetical protein JCM5353_003102 [Sporobolomyces roseus]